MKNNFTENNTLQQLKDKIDTLTETISMLKGSEQLLANAINDAPIGMITLTVDGKFMTVNMAFCELTGYTEKELLIMDISQITHPDDKHIGNNIIDELISGNAQKANFQKRYIHKNGNTIYTQVSTVLLKDEIGNPHIFFTQVVDITKIKHVEDALQKSSQILQRIYDAIPDVVIMQDKRQNIVSCNQSVQRVFGYTPEELIGQHYSILVSEKMFTDPKQKARETELLEKGYLEIDEFLFKKKNGELFNGSFNVALLRDEQGDFAGTVGTVHDITERKQAEEEIKSLARFPSENPNAILRADSNGILLYMNKAALTTFSDWKLQLGLTVPIELLELIYEPKGISIRKSNIIYGKQIFSITVIILQDLGYINFYAEEITERKQAEKEIKQKSVELEKQIKRSEKQRIATLSTLSELNENTKELQVEIDEHKKSELELAIVNKNLEMFAETVSSMNECVSISDKKHKIIFINKAFEDTYGYTKIEIIGKASQILHVEENSQLVNEIREKTKIGGWRGELLNKKKDGTIFPIELSVTPLRDKKNKIIAQIGIGTDITARKQAGEAIIKNEEKLQSIFQVAPVGIGLISNNIFVQVNKRICDITGYNYIELMGKNVKSMFTTEEEFNRVIKQQNESIQKKGRSAIDTVWKHKDRRKINVQLNVSPLNKWDISQGLTFTVLDITQKKQAEELLITSEKRYRKFFMEDLTGDYLTTRDGKLIDCNPQFLKIFGFKSLNQAQKYNTSKLFVTKSEREKFIKRLEKNKKLLDEQSELCKVNGEKIIVQQNASGEFDDDGKLINIRGYLFDITERVKAEREVIKLSSAVEQSPVSIVITDTEGVIEYVNPTFEKITGYSLNEIIGLKPSILNSGVTPDSEYRKLWERITAGKVWVGEFLNKKKNGQLYWESATIAPILDSNNNITHFLAVKEDITKKKEIVSELMEREEKYRTLTQNLNVGVYRSTPGENGKFIEVNPTFLKIFGFRSKNELEIYKTIDFYSNSRERDRIEEKLEDKGFLINEEVQLRKKDGSIFFASISATSAKDELGKVIHHDGIIEDITERKEMMERILQERDRSQLYLDIAGVMFLALDRKGDIILANQKTCEIIGTKEEDLIGKNWFDNYLPKDIHLNTKDVFNNLMNGNTKSEEFHENDILTISGEKRLIAWQNRTIKDETGMILGMISSGLDITDSKEDEELRNQLYKISRNLAESLDIDVVLNRMSKQARILLKCNGVTIYMCEDDKKTLKPVVAYDPPYTKQVLATKIDINKSYTGQAIKAKTGKIFNYHDNIKGAFHIKGTPQTDTDNIIVSPLEIDGEVIGALTLVRSKISFTERDLSIVNTFAVYGSTAIKNANIHKELLHEINERKKTENQLKESHDRYESIFNGTIDGIIYADWDGNIISVNSAAEKLLGVPRQKLIGNNAIELAKSNLSGNSLEKMLRFITNALNGDNIKDYLIKTGRTYFEFNTSLEKGKPGITVMIRNVTERNKAREDIVLHQNNLQSLSNELAMAEEKARRRLAITLHDKLGQSLVLANFKSSELKKIIKNSEHKKMLNEISDFLEDAINESRNITYELSPPVLYEMGLVPAISWKLDEIEKNNKIKTTLINQSKSYDIKKRDEIILYRSINELLQNVLKHSEAKSINVSFRLLTNDYRITVADNGIGFDLKAMTDKALSQKKFGLFSIMERIKYIGGRVEIDTKPRKGTKITINIPIKNKKIRKGS